MSCGPPSPSGRKRSLPNGQCRPTSLGCVADWACRIAAINENTPCDPIASPAIRRAAQGLLRNGAVNGSTRAHCIDPSHHDARFRNELRRIRQSRGARRRDHLSTSNSLFARLGLLARVSSLPARNHSERRYRPSAFPLLIPHSGGRTRVRSLKRPLHPASAWVARLLALPEKTVEEKTRRGLVSGFRDPFRCRCAICHGEREAGGAAPHIWRPLGGAPDRPRLLPVRATAAGALPRSPSRD